MNQKLPEMTPFNSHLLAHETTQKEIDELFNVLPWLFYLRLAFGAGTITKAEWHVDYCNRLEQAAAIERAKKLEQEQKKQIKVEPS